ncbi:E3 ubiquitin-protein ligase FANCL isoform X2 [Zerene cesonia]|uniref:E3 ubiquitin-protein ligase FANCL isoform X2 n=1 Tax=Zerene cesonia TaxID=33412 RepID=UPI0018E57302|nr:E3 ubiquitin-protein ligase FANCL isoform X2 [Zerene cesonia]
MYKELFIHRLVQSKEPNTLPKLLEGLFEVFADFQDDKTWLHLEVTPDGSATNVHLIGQSEIWQDKLQKGLLTWDQDKNIVENIYTIFDIKNQSVSPTLIPVDAARKQSSEDTIGPTCGICYCAQLPDYPGLPQPLCQNMNCDVYFHKNCLFQWLVACEGGRPPAFGVINGSCPTCLQPISCSDKDC